MVQTTFYTEHAAHVKLDRVSQLGRIFSAFAALGLEVESFSFSGSVIWDWDARFYHRYPENVMSRAIRSFNNNGKLLWMNNRLYIEVDDCYIPLPMDIRSLYDDGVSFNIRFD